MGKGSRQRTVLCWLVSCHSIILSPSNSLSPPTDIAAVSVDQARSRWEDLRGARFEASFATLDCYTESLSKAFSPAKFAQPFDVVSMQFCMHYAFENLQKARCMLDNVSRNLRPGGVFIGTIPNSELLLCVPIANFISGLPFLKPVSTNQGTSKYPHRQR